MTGTCSSVYSSVNFYLYTTDDVFVASQTVNTNQVIFGSLSAGTYSVIVTNSLGCMDSTATLAVSTELSTAFSNQCYSGVLSTNVIELNSEQQITIYPNPTISELVLEAEQISFTKQDNIKVFSILGKELYSSSINSQKTIIDLSKYSHGTYILVTTIDGIQKTFKILKE